MNDPTTSNVLDYIQQRLAELHKDSEKNTDYLAIENFIGIKNWNNGYITALNQLIEFLGSKTTDSISSQRKALVRSNGVCVNPDNGSSKVVYAG